ncbi:lysine N(6)-hydroxylase/L-ornithine N(5)-oxygenase family protein [Exiguobacterium algae]|uniref:lysine N(6)-hydroxylase/L-ornithine N(5)-oxygenase family protein n=1 Tax=Exiguobacterium algae TaxID=2751250 RepID=UPI001BED30C6|nr:SidA/IucD/PvdA family monooxygenase [Exiguobacterium algae]
MEQYDFVAVGCGPYNLGLMALHESTPLKGICFEQRDQLIWHEGMLIEGMTMQTHYLFDLVTPADPTSPYSYLHYLKQAGRLQTFIIQESMVIPRQEYNRYLKWVAHQLESIHFSSRVTDVREDGDGFVVTVRTGKGEEKVHAKHVVIGTGSAPLVPDSFEKVVHTSEYLMNRDRLRTAERVVVIGSGQSAAEVYLDLLRSSDSSQTVDWVTRSDVYESLEAGKLGEEIFSLDYVEYFHALSYEARQQLSASFERFRNGVNPDTLTAVYETLYQRTADGDDQKTKLLTQIEVDQVRHVDGAYVVKGTHQYTNQDFEGKYDAVVAATGYRPVIPDWVSHLPIQWETKTEWKVQARYDLATSEPLRGKLFTHTNLEHSHGPAATNLGMAVYRNAIILNEIAGKTVYEIRHQRPFTTF